MVEVAQAGRDLLAAFDAVDRRDVVANPVSCGLKKLPSMASSLT